MLSKSVPSVQLFKGTSKRKCTKFKNLVLPENVENIKINFVTKMPKKVFSNRKLSYSWFLLFDVCYITIL